MYFILSSESEMSVSIFLREMQVLHPIDISYAGCHADERMKYRRLRFFFFAGLYKNDTMGK